MLEVELKFRVADEAALSERLGLLGARSAGLESQRDAYFNHPARDFAETDEALRIRTIGMASTVTYKGPVLGTKAKSREELECGVADVATFSQVLVRLGFRPTLLVEKERRHLELEWDGRAATICLDRVTGLGLFCELELLATKEDREAAERSIWSLATRLGLNEVERQSYLEMLLEKVQKN